LVRRYLKLYTHGVYQGRAALVEIARFLILNPEVLLLDIVLGSLYPFIQVISRKKVEKRG
jgi:hypothetical protein